MSQHIHLVSYHEAVTEYYMTYVLYVTFVTVVTAGLALAHIYSNLGYSLPFLFHFCFNNGITNSK